MNKLIFGLTLLVTIPGAQQAQAVGCFSGGLAGGAAGHMANHTILGAIGGCIAGHMYHKHQLKQQDLQTKQSYDASKSQYDSQDRSQNPKQYNPPNSPSAYGR